MTWALDLDGVVWRADTAMPGSPEAIERLRQSEIGVTYITNGSSKRRSEYVAKLAGMGIEAEVESIIHSGFALATLIEPGERVLVCAGEGAIEGLESIGAEIIRDTELSGNPPPVDVAVIAWTTDFDYRRMALTTQAVLDGARLVATNMDRLYPTESGFLPGTGAIASAVAFATQTNVLFAGKPMAPMADLLQKTAGAVDVLVGDQPPTDGLLAARLGCDFVLVHTGVTPADHGPIDVPIALEVPDLWTAVDKLVP